MKHAIHTILLALFAIAHLGAEPIRLHPDNPHYFLYQNQPLIVITSAEHYGAVLNLDFDYTTYLDTLAQDGMNYTRIFTGSYYEKTGAFNIEKNTLAPALGRAIVPWARSDEPGHPDGQGKYDLTQWDEAYFNRLRDFVQKAQEKGIIVEVTFFTSIYSDDNWALCPLNPANHSNNTGPVTRQTINTLDNGGLLVYQEQMVRNIVRELNEFDNVIYEIQNEPYIDLGIKKQVPNPEDEGKTREVQIASDASLAWQDAITASIVEEEKSLPKKHLIAQNYANHYCPIDEVDPAVSILNFHYALPIAVLDNYHHNRVIAFDESGFAGNADDTYRKQAWNFILSGGGLFNNLDYSFTAAKEDGTDTNNAPGGGSQALRKQLKILQDFMSSFDYIRMAPKAYKVKSPSGIQARALASANQVALYLDQASGCEITLDRDNGTYTITWLDPRSGQYREKETIEVQNGSLTLATPEAEQDLALKIERITP